MAYVSGLVEVRTTSGNPLVIRPVFGRIQQDGKTVAFVDHDGREGTIYKSPNAFLCAKANRHYLLYYVDGPYVNIDIKYVRYALKNNQPEILALNRVPHGVTQLSGFSTVCVSKLLDGSGMSLNVTKQNNQPAQIIPYRVPQLQLTASPITGTTTANICSTKQLIGPDSSAHNATKQLKRKRKENICCEVKKEENHLWNTLLQRPIASSTSHNSSQHCGPTRATHTIVQSNTNEHKWARPIMADVHLLLGVRTR